MMRILPYNHPRTRALVWDMTDGHCMYCGVKMNPFLNFSVDHMIPQCLGGTDELSNLTPSCTSCNCKKGKIPFEEWLERNDHRLFVGSRPYRENYMDRHMEILNTWVASTYGDWDAWRRGELIGSRQ